MLQSLKRLENDLVTWVNQKRSIPKTYPFIMHDDEKELFKKYIRNSVNYLEFGLGGSTIFSLINSNANVTSIDTNKDWISFMTSYKFIKNNLNHRLSIHYIDIGPTKAWGYPVDENNNENFYKYSSEIFKITDPSIYDLILVDGRFRVACALQSIIKCHKNKNLKILIHDYSFRDEYKIVEKYLTIDEFTNSLYVFSIKEAIDFEELMKDYELNKNITV